MNDLAAMCADPETTPKDAWFIWQKNGHPPRFAHATEESALTEAARLATAYPGKSFLVMHCLHKVRVEPLAVEVAP